jgi:hypothetical protein
MHVLRSWRLRMAVGAGALVAAGLIAAVVQASIPDGNGLIHGCYAANGASATNGTQLDIVDSGTSCAKGQARISWNQTGPQGAPGPKGDTGATGPQGPPGTGGRIADAYVDHGVLDSSRSTGVNSVTIVAGSLGDVYCFDLVATPANVIANRALGSGNSGGTTPTVAGTTAMATLPCPAGTDAAVVSGINSTSSFFALFN